MMGDLYRHFADPLSDAVLLGWQAALLRGRKDLKTIGAYRRHADPMQIISGYSHAPRVHFEAPPSSRVPAEMKTYLKWFNSTAGKLPPLTRAGIAHLYFESIHPFEDGNGRIGRALAEKALARA
jgi:Fic family protein